jgi:threonine/homoserine/homoserine lactone efflux protein
MTTQTMLAFALFAFVSSITPGPNNLMLLASGVNFGLQRTVPHMLGIIVGCSLMMAAVAFGAHQLLSSIPYGFAVMKWASLSYLLWLAFSLGRNRTPLTDADPSEKPLLRPMSFIGACAFQWVNPKAWWMMLTACTTYLSESATAASKLDSIALMIVIFALVNLPAIGAWVWGGTKLRSLLSNPINLKRFNLIMACTLVISVLPILAESF